MAAVLVCLPYVYLVLLLVFAAGSAGKSDEGIRPYLFGAGFMAAFTAFGQLMVAMVRSAGSAYIPLAIMLCSVPYTALWVAIKRRDGEDVPVWSSALLALLVALGQAGAYFL